MVTTSTDTAGWLEPEGWCLIRSKCHCVTFTTNQSGKDPQVATLPPKVAFKTFSLTVIRDPESFEDELPVLLAWRLQWTLYFPSLQPSVSRLALLHLWWVDPSPGLATSRTAVWETQNRVTWRRATGAVTVVSNENGDWSLLWKLHGCFLDDNEEI